MPKQSQKIFHSSFSQYPWNIKLIILILLMEEKVPVCVEKLEYQSLCAHQANLSAKEVMSMPNMPFFMEEQLSKIDSRWKTFNLPESACQLSMKLYNNRSWQKTINTKVYAFIKEILNDHTQHFDILRKFELIEAEIKVNSNKTIKVYPLSPTSPEWKEGSFSQLTSKANQRNSFIRNEKLEGINIQAINSLDTHFNQSNKTNIRPDRSNITLPNHPAIDNNFVLEVIERAEDSDCYKHNVNDDIHSGMPNQTAQNTSHKSNKRPYFKKVSIVMSEENEYESREDIESQLFSSSPHLSLKDLDLPRLELSENLVEDIFDSSSPFLVNLSLCLLFKFFMKSKFQPEVSQIGWLLGISTMVAYKIFVDQSVEGLAEYYCQVLKIKSQELVFLQRWFLAGLNYEVVISNLQFGEMLMRINKDPKQ